MAIIDERLWRAMQQRPDARYDVIVRTDNDARPLAEACVSQGMTVHYQYRLLPGLSLTATGRALLALAAHPHVTSIEPDREVSV